MAELKDVRPSVQESLEQVVALLHKHKLVEHELMEGPEQRQENPHQVLVENRVHRLHLADRAALAQHTAEKLKWM